MPHREQYSPRAAQSRRALPSLARVRGGGELGARPGGGGHAPGQGQRPWREHAGSVSARSPAPAAFAIPILRAYALWRMKSATRSAIIMVVALVLARITSGITEASATRRPSSPYTRQYWSTTARGSEADPILQVPEICWEVVTFCRNQASSASSEASAWSLGARRCCTMAAYASCASK